MTPPQAAPGARPALAEWLYLDDRIVVVDKPPGIPSDRTVDPARPSAVSLAEELLRAHGLAFEGALRPAHRLDRDTSGVLVLARTATAAAEVGRAFADRSACEKVYCALVHPPPPWPELVVDNHLAPRGARQAVVHSGGRRAISWFLVRARADTLAWIEARPTTGRTHQLRVHLAGAGAPIVGDTLYGGVPAARCLLHAAVLRIGALRFEAPVPADFRAAAAPLGRAPGGTQHPAEADES